MIAWLRTPVVAIASKVQRSCKLGLSYPFRSQQCDYPKPWRAAASMHGDCAAMLLRFCKSVRTLIPVQIEFSFTSASRQR